MIFARLLVTSFDVGLCLLGAVPAQAVPQYTINAAGQVTGYSLKSTGRFGAFVSNGTSLTELDSLGGWAAAGNAINAAGQVAGYATTVAGQHAVFWDGSGGHDLGTLGGANSMALALNDAGQAVGWADTGAASTHAAIWSDGAVRNLGTLGGVSSMAADISSRGQAVGQSRITPGSSANHAFLYNHGTMYDLNDLVAPPDPLYGMLLTDSTGINDIGQIVAYSSTTGRSYLLTEVAEPASLLVLAIGLAGITTTRRRRAG